MLVDLTADDTRAGCWSRRWRAGWIWCSPTSGRSPGPGPRAMRSGRPPARYGRRILHEATVGAGLPIIDTYHKLVESGDRVDRIEGLPLRHAGVRAQRGLGRRSRFSAARSARAMRNGLYRARPARRPLRHGRGAQGADSGPAARLSGRALRRGGGVAGAQVGARRDAARASSSTRLEELDAGWARRVRRGGTAGRRAPLRRDGDAPDRSRSELERCRRAARSRPSRAPTISSFHHRTIQGEPAGHHRARARAPRSPPPACSTTFCGWRAHDPAPRASRPSRPAASAMWDRGSISLGWPWRAPATRYGRSGSKAARWSIRDPGHRRSAARRRAATPRPWPRRAVLRARVGDRRDRAIALGVRQGSPALGRPGRQCRLGRGRARSRSTRCSATRSIARAGRGVPRGGGRGGRPARRQRRPVPARRHRADPRARSARPGAAPGAAGAARGAGAARPAAPHRGRPGSAPARRPPRDRACTRRRRSAAMVAGARRRTTTPCWAGRSTTGSPSRRGRRCCPGFARPRRPRSSAGALGARSPAADRPLSPLPGAMPAAGGCAAAMAAAYAAAGFAVRCGWTRSIDGAPG